MKYVSLFAGIGGFELALNRLGHECVYANEWDKYSAITYEKNFGHKPDTHDITKVPTADIPDHDLLVGGFPCQAFSIAGKRLGFNDTRGTLFFEIGRILAAKRPSYLLLENVKGLLSHDNGRTFETIMRSLAELGYDAQWQVLNSKNFGVPQNRERVFIVGHLRGTARPPIFPIRGTDKGDLSALETAQVVYWKNSKDKWVNENRLVSPTIKTHTDLVKRPLILHNIYGGFNEKHNREFADYSPTIRTPKGGGHIPSVLIGGGSEKTYADRMRAIAGFPGQLD